MCDLKKPHECKFVPRLLSMIVSLQETYRIPPTVMNFSVCFCFAFFSLSVFFSHERKNVSFQL